jgi:membrane-bound lytic murein transglycosylase B
VSRRTPVLIAVGAVAGVVALAVGAAVLAGSLAAGSAGAGAAAGAGATDARATGAETPDAAPTEDGLTETVPAAEAVAGNGSGDDGSARGIAALVDAAWTDRTAAATGIPRRALLAYAGAELRLRAEAPACGLGWNTLAAIGFVESEHGTLFGGSIGADGLASPAIVGIPLNGDGVEAIRDTDGGLLDGDSVWDRAVGPMQFIPGTWEQFGADGDGDGRSDVHAIDDAALAAARYLCASGGDLREAGDWIAAVSSYNSTLDYNHRVASAADTYAALAG